MLFLPTTKHTRLVFALKLACAVVIIALVALLVILSMHGQVDNKFKLSLPAHNTSDDISQKMQNPHFQGVDSHNQPYDIIADVAVQKTANIFLLENIKATITLNTGRKISLIARMGTLSVEEKIIDLSGAVHMSSDDGQDLYTESARADIRKNTVSSNQPVRIKAPSGQLDATGFILRQNDKKIIFTGPIKVKILSKTGDI